MWPKLKSWWLRARPDSAHPPDSSRYSPLVQAICAKACAIESEPDSRIIELARGLRGRTDISVDESFPLAVEAIRRGLGISPFDVQILGALVMNDGAIAEMQTGEGKTLTAVMTVFHRALAGNGVHVWTANDYLALRDAAWMRGRSRKRPLRPRGVRPTRPM